MQNRTPLIAAKMALRTELKQRRRNLSAEQRRDYSEQIAQRLYGLPEYQAAASVFTYISYATEVQTHEIIKRLLLEKPIVTVPRIVDSDYMQAHRFVSWESCQPDAMGILSPQENDIYTDKTDLVLTPGLGFTLQGQRIGFGAGYYDKWFNNNEIGCSVALAFETQLVDNIPVEETDIPVDIIITEKRVIRVRG
jgi:5-formyltetrahydrofolate cyclo-ligase